MKRHKITIRPRRNRSGTTSYLVESGVYEGKRQRKFFKTKKEAEGFAQELGKARAEKGSLALALSQKKLWEAHEAFQLLAPYGKTLLDAVRYYLRHAQPSGGNKQINDLVEEILASKQRSGKKPRYIKELRCKFNRFKKDFGTATASSLAAKTVEDWLYKQEFSMQTRANYLRDLKVLFSFAESKKYCAENPLSEIEKINFIPTETEILSVHQVVLLLAEALSYSKFDLVPYVAIGLFAGLRSCELEKLDWKDIKLRQKIITVHAENSKTSQRRLIPIRDNLITWLAPYREEGRTGPIVSKGWREHFQNLTQRLLKKAKSMKAWPHNALRHSFASYHLAKHQDAGVTATMLGHSSVTMVHRHYKELVSPQEAAKFWRIIGPELGEEKWAWKIFAEEMPEKRPIQSEVPLSKQDLELVQFARELYSDKQSQVENQSAAA